MSFTPPPIIPQTREQAEQRDQLHGIATQAAETAGQKAVRLAQAIQAHHDYLQDGQDRQAADQALWKHIHPPDPGDRP